jgi:hypothetical protein
VGQQQRLRIGHTQGLVVDSAVTVRRGAGTERPLSWLAVSEVHTDLSAVGVDWSRSVPSGRRRLQASRPPSSRESGQFSR